MQKWPPRPQARIRPPIRLRRPDGDQGETLLELIIAITILGVCVVAIGSGIAMSITISALHRNQANAQDALHNYAETLQGLYQACTTAATPTAFYTQSLAQLGPPGFGAPQVSVQYWMPTGGPSGTGAFAAACPGTDQGLQQVTLTLASTTGTVTESLVVDLRSSS
jgi:type II secretory pathway pseudopilin PulG